MPESNTLEMERNELNVLIEKGVQFHVPKLSVLKYLSKKKERTFTIHQPYLGRLDYLSAVFIEMEIDELKLQENPMQEAKQLVKKTAKLCAKAIAIAVLDTRFKIRLFSGFLTNYFYWRITPAKLLQLALLINAMSNYPDFTNSIRLMSGARTTIPAKVETLIEEPQKD